MRIKAIGVLLSLTIVAACATVEGIGRDISSGARAVGNMF